VIGQPEAPQAHPSVNPLAELSVDLDSDERNDLATALLRIQRAGSNTISRWCPISRTGRMSWWSGKAGSRWCCSVQRTFAKP
jgi:hypothetical protein